jgi:putative Mn2+ efflux pump MntP
MFTLIAGSAVLSLFHALLPSHWLPVLAISRKERWSPNKTILVTFWVGLAHVLSTVLIGLALAGLGDILAEKIRVFTDWIAPSLLILIGLFYVYQHYYHHHFHLHEQATGMGILASLTLAMFLSPCFEIEGYFLAAGQYGWDFVLLLAVIYGMLTLGGMLTWMRLALHGLRRLDWHPWEHYAGLISGVTVILSGILMLIWH